MFKLDFCICCCSYNVRRFFVTTNKCFNIGVKKFVLLNYPNEYPEVPQKYLIRKKYPYYLFLIDNKIAKKSVEIIRPHLSCSNSNCLLESYPSFGFITRYLLPLTSKLLLFEPDRSFANSLKELHACNEMWKKSTCNVTIFNLNLFYFNSEFKEDLFNDIPIRRWNEDVGFQVISAATKETFFYLIRSVVFQKGLLNRGRPELFLFVKPSLYRKLIATPKTQNYHRLSVLFQIAYDVELLEDNIPRKSFLPWPSEKKRHMKDQELDGEVLFLIKVTGKADLFDRIPDRNKLTPLYYFVMTLMMSRKRALIPTLELKIPKCGPRLIMMGYTIYTQTGELTYHQYVELFLEIAKWPEYKLSLEHSLFEQFYSEELTNKKIIEHISPAEDEDNIEHHFDGSSDISPENDKKNGDLLEYDHEDNQNEYDDASGTYFK